MLHLPASCWTSLYCSGVFIPLGLIPVSIPCFNLTWNQNALDRSKWGSRRSRRGKVGSKSISLQSPAYGVQLALCIFFFPLGSFLFLFLLLSSLFMVLGKGVFPKVTPGYCFWVIVHWSLCTQYHLSPYGKYFNPQPYKRHVQSHVHLQNEEVDGLPKGSGG
jgi:hypothetical protein